ncbi:rhomboid family intramembrane serine protease [Bartonella sp. B35(2025)]
MKNSDYQCDNTLLLPEEPRGPLLNVPFIIIILIVFCFCIYFLRYFFSSQFYIRGLEFFSFTPALFKDEPLAFCHTIISYSFMHGSLEHISINMIWLLVFGSPLVRHLGSFRFLIFWILTAFVSALTYFIFHQDSIVSLVGASGAISGMMGAVARYGFSPIPFGIDKKNERFFGPLWSIKKALCSKIILIYIGVWLIINFIVGVFSFPFEGDGISIAWEAHIGGFSSGFLLIGLFDISQEKSKIIV